MNRTKKCPDGVIRQFKPYKKYDTMLKKIKKLIRSYNYKSWIKQFQPYWRMVKYKGSYCKMYLANNVRYNDILEYNNLVDNVHKEFEKNG